VDSLCTVAELDGPGWMESAEFTRPNTKFGDMSVVAAEIKKIGMRPGASSEQPFLCCGWGLYGIDYFDPVEEQ
jgi:hypothetical protein